MTLHHFLRCKMKKKIRYVIFVIVILNLLHFFGVFTHLFERDFYSNFEYPLNEDIIPYIEQLKNNDKPDVAPINNYNYKYVKNCANKCKTDRIRLLIIVKSALNNMDRRKTIRHTFGYERRFSDVNVRTIFMLGIHQHDDSLQKTVDSESEKYQDIVQADFIDAYFNNTIKTMMGFKWAVEFCPNSQFYLFTDDDMYISIKNVLRFIRNPSNYPKYVEDSLIEMKKIWQQKKLIDSSKKTDCDKFGGCKMELNKTEMLPNNINPLTSNKTKILRSKRQALTNYELPDDVILYTGYMFESSPHRHKTSKWYISLKEYPWHMWPPYISAGAYILSREALTTMYYASFYTVHFRFDDIYLGILAKKSGIKPFHCKEFYFNKKEYNIFNYRYVLASHGYDDPSELMRIWIEQKSEGNA